MRNLGSKTVVGLDIEPTYVAAVQGRPGHVAVERAATAPLAPGVVQDGEVVDIDALATTLRELFAQNKLPRRVRVGVANQRIVVRRIDLPPLDDAKQIASAVRFQAADHIPMPIDQAVIAHHSLGRVETADGPRTRVVVVAARRDMIERLLEATRRAGLRAQGIDLSAFAMIRALHSSERTAPTVYMNVGGVTNLAIAEGRTCLFTRVVAQGPDAIASDLAERLGLTRDHAHGWLRHVGLVTPLDQIDGEEEIVAETRNVLSDGVSRVAHDVRNSLDYYAMQEGGAAVEHAVLTGPALAIPGFPEQLGSELGLPLEIGTLPVARGSVTGDDGAHLAVAAGLTVEELAA